MGAYSDEIRAMVRAGIPPSGDLALAYADLLDQVEQKRVETWNAAIDAAADEADEHRLFAKGLECCGDCIRKMKWPAP